MISRPHRASLLYGLFFLFAGCAANDRSGSYTGAGSTDTAAAAPATDNASNNTGSALDTLQVAAAPPPLQSESPAVADTITTRERPLSHTGNLGARPIPDEVTSVFPPPPPPPAESNPDTFIQEQPGLADFPLFPAKVPKASSAKRIPRGFLQNSAGNTTIGYVVNERLLPILDEAGYEYSFYRINNDGLAIVTRAERIRANGATDTAYRYFNGDYFDSYSDYLLSLFRAKPRYFRIIVFMISPTAVVQSGKPMTAAEGKTLFEGGADRPALTIMDFPFSDRYECTALIYECEKPNQEDDQVLVSPSALPCETHLKMAGIWQKLQNNR